MADQDDYQRRIATTVMQAIFDASKVSEDGKDTVYIVSGDVVAALVNVMASLMEGAPDCETAKGMREVSDGIGRKVLVQMRAMRRITETTGSRPFDAVYARTN